MAPALPGTAQNFEQIGHTSLGSIGWHGGLALAGSCAYVGNRRASAIAIVDVSDPATPTAAGAIPFPPGAQPAELRTLPAHNLLVVADLAQSPHLYTFDVSDCTAPRQMAALTLHTPLHEFFLWQGDGAAGGQVLLFGATFGQGPPDLLVIDLSVPAAPTERARWTAAAEDAKGALHSLSVSPDGSQAWLALWRGGLLLADVAPPQIALTRNASGGYLPAVFANAHSAVPLAEPGLVLLTSEIYTCPFGGVAIADVRTPARPRLVGGLRLPENRCPARPGDAVFTAHNPLVVGDLVFLTWYGGGLQALDVSDPSAPQRVGQFVPAGAGAAAESYVGRYPVQMWSYPVLRDGLLYVTDIQSGLYVIRYTGPGAEKVAQVARAEGNVTVRK